MTRMDKAARRFAGMNGSTIDPCQPRVDKSPSKNAGWQELILACQDMPKFQWNLACWMWAGWDHKFGEVMAAVEAISRHAMARAERRSRPLMAEKMAGLVLLEMRHDNCRTCGGRGGILTSHGLSDCQVCTGHGIKGFSDRERARWLGIAPTTYRESWKNIYEHVFERVRRERDGAVAHIQGRQKGGLTTRA